MHISARTLDDLLRYVLEAITSVGEPIQPDKGPAREISGVLLELENPRARLSRTETRGKLFSGLGELCWYLAKTNQLEFIRYYIPEYIKSADGDVIFGGYGPRFFQWHGQNQVHNIIHRLKVHSVSRKAVIQLFDAADLEGKHKDIPCTCTLQFLIRRGQLNLITYMRSNDWFLGLPHDFFAFTMLQEIVASALSVELGTYKHVVGSLHLYDRDEASAQSFLGEAWQSTLSPMPSMPREDPWNAIGELLKAESTIRRSAPFNNEALDQVDPYWADLIRLLLVFREKRNREQYSDSQLALQSAAQRIAVIRDSMSSPIYNPFITKLLEEFA